MKSHIKFELEKYNSKYACFPIQNSISAERPHVCQWIKEKQFPISKLQQFQFCCKNAKFHETLQNPSALLSTFSIYCICGRSSSLLGTHLPRHLSPHSGGGDEGASHLQPLHEIVQVQCLWWKGRDRQIWLPSWTNCDRQIPQVTYDTSAQLEPSDRKIWLQTDMRACLGP